MKKVWEIIWNSKSKKGFWETIWNSESEKGFWEIVHNEEEKDIRLLFFRDANENSAEEIMNITPEQFDDLLKFCIKLNAKAK